MTEYSSTWAPIVRHELLVSGKVTFLTFAVQLIFQLLPLESTNIFVLTWLLCPLALGLGFVSDLSFYKNALNDTVRKERLKCNFLLCLTSWAFTIAFFRYLDLTVIPDVDKDLAENAIPGLGIQLTLERIFEENGYIPGLLLLLGSHFAAVATFASSVRTVLFFLDIVIQTMAPYLPSSGREREGQSEPKGAETEKEEKSE